MCNGSKSKLYLLILSVFAISFLGLWFVNAISFTERLWEIWLDADTFANKRSVSRYEVARLLNAANCEDCIQAPDWMKQTYTQKFWNDFKSIDGKDFNDINYWAAVWNKKSYYYCVAYVWDNGYMAWYPSTSTKCQWNFCGQDAITVSEVYQTVLNIIQDQIRSKYQIDWSNVKTWMKWLSKDKRNTILNKTNIDAINNASTKLTYAQNNDEFQAWLKYCMYNLSWCNFQTFWKIWQAYWPISELNILYKEWMITAEDAEKVYTSTSINWKDALRIFWAVFDNFSSCSFNVDYDCDWITNGKDNCPYTYNTNQYDLDDDGIWNVCDDDIDWDWIKNPVWIVDDNNHIVISLWDSSLDEKPLGDWELWFSFFINVEAITTWVPAIVRFNSISSEDIESIERDFWDWTKSTISNQSKTTHSYQWNWMFIVRAIAKSKKWWKSFAMTKFFVAAPQTENYMLNVSSSAVLKNKAIEYTLTPIYSWDLDSIVRSINNWEEKSLKVSDKFKTTIKEDGMYVVNVKWYKNKELKAVAMISLIKNWSPQYAGMVVNPKDLWDETSIATSLVWINRSEIEKISINWWGEITTSTDLIQKYAYTEGWLKTIQQTVKLEDWTEFYAVATIMVNNPNLAQSYAVNMSGKRLAYNQNEKMSLGLNMYPNVPVLSLFTSYQAWQKQFLSSPNLANTILNFAYATAWDKTLTNTIELNRCIALINQWTVHITSVDICESALKNWSISKYKCDQDKDWIPDICDDDIDWDGIKNLVGIITKENKDCSVTSDNVSIEILKKQIWVCSLDNCPFNSNPDQSDLNNNWMWEVCEISISSLLTSTRSVTSDEEVALTLDKDQDQDWVPDSRDDCVNVPWNSANGCPQYYNQNCWVFSSCWNGKLEAWETCLNCPEDAWECCWNGNLESRETCETCSADAWICGLCWNWKLDEWENCKSCPQDVWDCTAKCWNLKIEDGETCETCPTDVWECTATCWDWRIQVAEDCDNCSKDVKQCKTELCWNWKLDIWEECDSGNNNWKDKKCTLKCTNYKPSEPYCWDWEIDEWETCLNCPEDLWYRCVKDWDYGELCWNWKLDEWETCLNCPKDVWECTATCWDWRIQVAEDCDNCSKDVKQCKTELCWNWKVDEWEECDSGSNNWKDGKCTLRCTKYIPWKPLCWNGKEDIWETCLNCSVDLWYRCVEDWDYDTCGNWKVDEWETCKNCSKDLWPCTAYCWDGKIQDAETCLNCPADVWKCTATCWDWKVQVAEDCDNCSKDVKQCKTELCWNWKLDIWEECDSGSNNWKDNKCTLKCTNYDASKPLCWNWVEDEWEDCYTCPVDLWYRCVENWFFDICGNWKVDEWETCKNCPQDVWECTAYCWDWKIQDAETCKNCPQDVWECTATCWDWKVQDAEDCDNCPQDVKQCRAKLCWNGKVDIWEECDHWSDNWKSWDSCSKKCVSVKPWNPNYWDWEIDDEEKCGNASIDLWYHCVDNWWWTSYCWDGKVQDWETCLNCPQDLWECMATCWNWKVDEWETCLNCSKDVWECTATCWDGKIQDAEDCGNCPQDVKQCRAELCWNGKVDEWEECDSGKNNWRPWDICTVKCVKAKSWDSNYWNWDVDDWEKCNDASIDLWYRCIGTGSMCWDLVVHEWENCINCAKDLQDLCVDDWKDKCGNGKKDVWETCQNCPQDLKDCELCGNWIKDKWENCTNCSKDMKDPCVDDWKDKCGNGKEDEWETCQNCSKDLGKRCIEFENLPDVTNNEDDLCWNWKQDEWEDCNSCPEDLWWCVENNNCNTCPCEYADFSTDLTRWDTIRAKFWDKQKFAFYRYSNSVAVENYLDLK